MYFYAILSLILYYKRTKSAFINLFLYHDKLAQSNDLNYQFYERLNDDFRGFTKKNHFLCH